MRKWRLFGAAAVFYVGVALAFLVFRESDVAMTFVSPALFSGLASYAAFRELRKLEAPL